LQVPKHLPNPVQAEHVAKLLGAAPHHLMVTMTLAAHTSMRLEEILGLEWSEVNFELRIIKLRPERTKALEGRVIHLTATAHELLRFLDEHRPKGQSRVVLYWPSGFGNGEPRPVTSIRTAWLRVLRQAGLTGKYRFHDLRGVIGTFLAREGVAPLTLQRWLGHRDIKTTMRYVALADSAQREASRLAESYSGTADVMERIAAPSPQPSTKEEARKYVGVYPVGRTRFEARLVVTVREDGSSTKKALYLGCFESAEAAALAYDTEARKHGGRRLNFPTVETLPRPESQTKSPRRGKRTYQVNRLSHWKI
jgi:hypothetical protein